MRFPLCDEGVCRVSRALFSESVAGNADETQGMLMKPTLPVTQPLYPKQALRPPPAQRVRLHALAVRTLVGDDLPDDGDESGDYDLDPASCGFRRY